MGERETVANSCSLAAPQNPNAQRQVIVSPAELPLHCPRPDESLWNSHPRVFLPIDSTRGQQAECPYCGTRYRLQQVNVG